MNSSIGAADLLASAKELRKSSSKVYLNPDLTPAEAQAAYELRAQRREKKQQQQQQSQHSRDLIVTLEDSSLISTAPPTSDAPLVGLNATAWPFEPVVGDNRSETEIKQFV